MLKTYKHLLIIPKNNRSSVSYKILVADDSSFMRTVLSTIINNTSKVGEIYMANNGAEVIKMYKKVKPDLVTMDLDMPGMNGIDAANKIKSIDPKAKIVMVTASDQYADRVEAEKIGVCGYITKPFDRLQIREIIENLSK